MGATKQIPIVFPTVGDPVGEGMVRSLAHPGTNVTGLTNLSPELHTKRLAFLKEALPGIRRVAMLTNGANPYYAEPKKLYEAAGKSVGLELKTFDIRDQTQIARTFERILRAHAQAVLCGNDVFLYTATTELGELALKYRLPLVAATNAPGVLLAYTIDANESYRRSANYVDKILKGASPADLPIEQPSKFALVINLKTAKALGLTIPRPLLARADEVIQ